MLLKSSILMGWCPNNYQARISCLLGEQLCIQYTSLTIPQGMHFGASTATPTHKAQAWSSSPTATSPFECPASCGSRPHQNRGTGTGDASETVIRVRNDPDPGPALGAFRTSGGRRKRPGRSVSSPPAGGSAGRILASGLPLQALHLFLRT